MVKQLTMIARVSDAMPLAEGLEVEKTADLDVYKGQAKALFKKLAAGGHPPQRLSMESGPYVFHVLVEKGVVYLALAERSYPKKLAFQYLSELCTEFDLQNGSQVSGATRPYAFVKFDTFIQKTSKLYADSRAPRNTAKLAQDLAEVRAVVTRSVADVLGAGERLESVSAASANLRSETQRYAKKAHMLSRQALIRQWMPLIAVGGVVIALLLMRWLARRLFGR